jgi:hypothetical protein
MKKSLNKGEKREADKSIQQEVRKQENRENEVGKDG